MILKYLSRGLFLSLFLVIVLHLVHFYITDIPEHLLNAVRWFLAILICVFAYQKKSLTTWILASMVVGLQIGITFPDIAVNLRFLSQIFIRMIKTIIAPILISTLVVGIAGHGNIKQVGRMGWKSMLYFEIVTTIALFIGVFVINITQAGKGITLPEGLETDLPETQAQNWQDIILHSFPENIVKSIYHGDVLPIVVFSILFGIALLMVQKTKREPLLHFMESLAETMFKFTRIVMYFAPIGVGAAMAYTVGHLGIEILRPLSLLLFSLYIALIILVLVVFLPVALIVKLPFRAFQKAMSEPVSIAFATTSSESALPIAMENLEKIGVPRKIVSFVLPMGYSFNLDGTTLYLALASIFVAQAAGVDLTWPEQLLMVFTLMLTSKGVAGVPRASLIILLATVSSFNLPLWPVMAIMGIDELMDMARTSVNVLGNSLAAVVVARWEDEFDDDQAAAYVENT